MSKKESYFSGWQDYQEKLHRDARKKALLKKLPIMAVYSGCCLLVLFLVYYAGSRFLGHFSQAGHRLSPTKEAPDVLEEKIRGENLLFSLESLNLDPTHLSDHFVVEKGETCLTVHSSLNTEMQDYVLALLRRSKTEKAAVVILNPTDGRILVMASYEKNGKKGNLCTKAIFPAASLFKIVSAAAALETAGFTPDKAVSYTGGKHTLYKRQLKKKRGRYTTTTSFRKAFASSINSVFGKMGIYDLGRKAISEYANKFLFNHVISFDFPVEKSTIIVPEDDYGLAEIASGFNRQTLISPIHAALLASAVANKGTMMSPHFIDSVFDESGNLLFKSRPTMLTSPINSGTAESLKVMMGETVVRGTCRKAFRSLRRSKAFKDVELGAKTGTINDKLDRFKYDWIAAYALPREAGNGISISVLSIHGEKLGIRASELGRYIIKRYMTL
jgi:cell division protein FtsI/penicillin-binding protein 2